MTYTSNAMQHDALMDGRGQEVLYPDGDTFIVYCHDDARPEYTVWRKRDDGLFWFVCIAPTTDAARLAMWNERNR